MLQVFKNHEIFALEESPEFPFYGLKPIGRAELRSDKIRGDIRYRHQQFFARGVSFLKRKA
jgi:hypothetical protein